MPKTNLQRRNVLKGSLLAGTAAVIAPGIPRSASGGVSSVTRLPDPAEAKILSSKEYGQKRIRHVQEAIKKAGLDALIISNRSLDYISYVSNFHPWPLQTGVAYIPAEGPPTLYLQMYSFIHAQVAKKTIWIEDIVDVPKDTWSESSSLNFYKELTNKVKDRKLTRGRIGLAGGEVDWMLPDYFRRVLPGLRVEDANAMLYALVIVRDEVELALMRHSQKIIDEVTYPLFQELLVAGALDADVYADLFYAMLKAGADSLNTPITTRLLFGAASYDSGTWAGGAENRRLQKGDIILAEPIPRFHFYQTEKMFTFAIGKDVPESQKRGAQVIYDSFLMALGELKPGREMKRVFEKCNNFIKSKGYKDGSTVMIGHWIGGDNHQGALITSEGTEGLILQPGMVLSWHPNVVVPGEVRTCCSACLLMTDTGVENMSKIPLEPMYYV